MILRQDTKLSAAKAIRYIGLSSLLALGLAACSPQETPEVAMPQLSFEEDLQQQLIQAQEGDVISIPAGRHEISRSLSLNVSGVTIKGAGIDDSVLSFKGQLQGAEGFLISADNLVLEDFAVEDTQGDAIKINDSNNVVIRNVRTEWTGGPLETNGAYGLYPVQSSNILIDGAVAIGASDAGIYVGQSNQIIVRNSRAEYNVAGIEIENSTFADVHDNVVTNNTGGILVFDLPNLEVQGGRNTRVFSNNVYDNNTDNFAPEGNIVAGVPAGTGMMILANDSIEVFDNTFTNNSTASVLMVSYFINNIPFDDPNYDPYPEQIYIHNNTYNGGGDAPDSEPLQMLAAATGQSVPDIVWDGWVRDGDSNERLLCIQEGDGIRFANLDASNGFAAPSFDASAHDCSLPQLSVISLSSAQ